jgi:hypothetical protein
LQKALDDVTEIFIKVMRNFAPKRGCSSIMLRTLTR